MGKMGLTILFSIILSLQLTGCQKNESKLPGAIVNKAIIDTDEIVVVFGNGNQLTMTGNSTTVVTDYLKAISFEEVDLPDTVGQSFTLKLSREKELDYTSTGYLRINETLYKAKDADIVAAVHEYVVNYGFEELPDLENMDNKD